MLEWALFFLTEAESGEISFWLVVVQQPFYIFLMCQKDKYGDGYWKDDQGQCLKIKDQNNHYRKRYSRNDRAQGNIAGGKQDQEKYAGHNQGGVKANAKNDTEQGGNPFTPFKSYIKGKHMAYDRSNAENQLVSNEIFCIEAESRS